MGRVVTFGEIMGRVTPCGFRRFRQAVPGTVDMTFAGAEANVAVSICQLGHDAAFVSALPTHAIADACVATLQGFGVDTQHVLRTDDGRLGLYFLETGANQRPSTVLYDRVGSSTSLTPAGAYPWKTIFQNADWFHLTGITPAISRTASEAALRAVQAAKAERVPVSFDLNFRKKLWHWDPPSSPRDLSQKTVKQIMPFVDVLMGNEEDAGAMLGIEARNTDVGAGILAIDSFAEVARQIAGTFENVSKIAITLRESVSATCNNWGAMLYDVGREGTFFAPLHDGAYRPYRITNIVDRVGSGDAFAAALIVALITSELSEPETAIAFATAASCLAHSIHGDFNCCSRAEVEALMRGSGTGRVQR